MSFTDLLKVSIGPDRPPSISPPGPLAWGFGAWRSQGPQRNGHLLGLLTTYEWDDPPSAAIYEIL